MLWQSTSAAGCPLGDRDVRRFARIGGRHPARLPAHSRHDEQDYFLDKAEQHGATFEMGLAFQNFLNARQPKGARQVRVAFIPVARDQLFEALIAGKGDIAAAGLTITPERLDRVDFAAPFARGVKEVLVTPAGDAEVVSPEGLSGLSAYVRPSPSYFESVTQLNARLAGAGKPPVTLVAAGERLEDEDILELVSAGIVPAAVVDDYLATFWTGVLPGPRVHPHSAIRDDGQIAWAVRKTLERLEEPVSEGEGLPSQAPRYLMVVTRHA